MVGAPPARKSSRVNRKYKTKYRVTNWRECERGLRSRGDITVRFSEEAREAWTPPKNGRRRGACPELIHASTPAGSGTVPFGTTSARATLR